MNKPPLGVMPKNVWKDKRICALSNAINSHIKAKEVPMAEWDEEINELTENVNSFIGHGYLYKDQDDKCFITKNFNGFNDLLMYITEDVTFGDIRELVPAQESMNVFNRLIGVDSTVEIFVGKNNERS